MVDIPYHTHTFDIPTASEGEIRAGIEAGKAITPDRLFPVLADKAGKATTLAGYGITDAATKEQGQKADSAVQPASVSAVGFSGRYDDLLSKPDLGGASGLNVGTTAGTVAAGDDSRIVNAVQKSLSITAGNGLVGGGTLSANISLALSSTSIASLALADTAVQPTRKFTAGAGLTGGGDFSADRSVALNATSIASLAKADTAVQPVRAITVGAGLAGGGDLSDDRTVSLNAATIASLELADNAAPKTRKVTAGTGLSGGGDLTDNISIGLSAASQASLEKADSAVQPAGIADFSTKTELSTGLSAKLDKTSQAVDSAKLQGYTAATLPISTATQTALSGKATTAQGNKADTAVQPADLGALATKGTVTTADITATGSTSSGALLTRGGAWVDPSGGGDMFRAVYDPTNKATDAFDMTNMIEATNALILTDAERVAIAANTGARHTHSNKATLDATTASFLTADKTALQANTAARHTHDNKAVLDATTASFLTAEKTKLANIAAGATVNTGTVTSIGVAVPTGLAVTGAITTSGTITISYASGYQGYTTAEANKLAGVETGAQVNTVTSVAGKTGAITLAKADVGLGNVDNTSDANKPVSTAQQTALNLKLDETAQAADSAKLGGKTEAQLPFLGVGQTWQDVTASRVSGTSYRNTTGKPILVYTSPGSNGEFLVSSNNSTWVLVGRKIPSGGYSTNAVIVPHNWYYKANGDWFTWQELR